MGFAPDREVRTHCAPSRKVAWQGSLLAASTYVPGGSSTYTLIISNAGPNSVNGATVADVLPRGTTLVAPGVTCFPAANCSGSAQAYPFAGDGTTNILSGLLVNLPATGSTTISVPITYSSNPANY